LVGDEQERADIHAHRLAADTDHEVEQSWRLATSEQDGEPGDDHYEHDPDWLPTRSRRRHGRLKPCLQHLFTWTKCLWGEQTE
jgi:hypothetical protein